jgi:hypothetical protein
MVRLQTTDAPDHNMFYFDFVSTPEWRLIEIPFTALKQGDWGPRGKFTGTGVKALLISNYSPPGEDFGRFALQIDELTLI